MVGLGPCPAVRCWAGLGHREGMGAAGDRYRGVWAPGRRTWPLLFGGHRKSCACSGGPVVSDAIRAVWGAMSVVTAGKWKEGYQLGNDLGGERVKVTQMERRVSWQPRPQRAVTCPRGSTAAGMRSTRVSGHLGWALRVPVALAPLLCFTRVHSGPRQKGQR